MTGALNNRLAVVTRGTTGKGGKPLNAGQLVELDPDTHAKLWSTRDIRDPKPEELKPLAKNKK